MNLKIKIGRKLRSSCGSSILFALLLLLVCTVIGSVVLTAGTAAAGRLAETAEMDQRFYAVQSAAQLFKEKFDGQTVEIVRTKTTTEEEYNSLVTDESGNVSSSPEGSADPVCDYDLKWGNNSFVGMGQSILRDAAIELLIGSDLSPEKAFTAEYPAFSSPANNSNTIVKTFEIIPSVSSGDSISAPLEVTVQSTLRADGTLEFIFTSPGESDKYSSKLIFTAMVDEGTYKTKSNTSKSVSDVSENTKRETIRTVTVKTLKSSITWNFASAGAGK